MLNLVLRLVAVAACVFGVAICARISGEVLRDDRGGSTIITTYIDPETRPGDVARENPKVNASEQEMPGVVAITSSLAWPHLDWKSKSPFHTRFVGVFFRINPPTNLFQPATIARAVCERVAHPYTYDNIHFPIFIFTSPWKMVATRVNECVRLLG
ncbi:hypothetical protein AYO20_05035 [Fonsecaea nubica]|uniref:Uncharacterized protein n=1 Tax=Fonsecaea nubica TaxID=856822 RepID=A0A178D2K7_9EURO|nr:hypothetical protein AYO20_05035 [Fonsecaea nubica]OAL35654.1 hypothetical protein AYO20_05035 [Fonsecaea nubica]